MQGWSRRDFLRRSLLASGVVVASGLASACSRTEFGTGLPLGEGTALQKIRDQGWATVGYANERPYAYRGSGGELVGEAPSLHGEIFKRMGDIEVRGVQFGFDSLIPALNAGIVDVVSAGMFITPERCEQAAFSNPEYVALTALLVPSGNPEELSDYESVAQSGVTLAVMNGAVEVGQAEAAGVTNTQIVADQQSGIDAVTTGRANAFALTDISLNWLAQSDDEVEVLPSFTPEVDGEPEIGAGAAVFRRNDSELVDAFNEELRNILDEDQWLSLVEDFGFMEDNAPDPDQTADEFCEE